MSLGCCEVFSASRGCGVIIVIGDQDWGVSCGWLWCCK